MLSLWIAIVIVSSGDNFTSTFGCNIFLFTKLRWKCSCMFSWYARELFLLELWQFLELSLWFARNRNTLVSFHPIFMCLNSALPHGAQVEKYKVTCVTSLSIGFSLDCACFKSNNFRNLMCCFKSLTYICWKILTVELNLSILRPWVAILNKVHPLIHYGFILYKSFPTIIPVISVILGPCDPRTTALATWGWGKSETSRGRTGEETWSSPETERREGE